MKLVQQQMKEPMINRFLSAAYGHPYSVGCLALASVALLLSCVLYFLSPLLEDDYHVYQRFLPWVYYLDWGQYNSFVVDHIVVFAAIALPMLWLLLVNVAYSDDQWLLLLRVSCCLIVCISLTVILTDFLSRRVMIAIISLAYGALGLVYAWSVPLWNWYIQEARAKGLIAFLPSYLQHVLLRMTVLEWLTDRSLTDQLQQFLPFLLPLTKSEQNRLLEQLPATTQIVMTRPGMIGFLPESVQSVLLPAGTTVDALVRRSQVQEDQVEEVDPIKQQETNQLVGGFNFHAPEVEERSLACQQQPISLESQQEIVTDIISQRMWSYVRQGVVAFLTFVVCRTCSSLIHVPSSRTLDRTAALSSALFVLQLYASRRSRRAMLSFLQFLFAASCVSVGALALVIRMLQLSSLKHRTGPLLLRFFHQYLLQRPLPNSSNQQLTASTTTPTTTTKRVQKAATTASIVLAMLYAVRKLKR